MTLSPGRICAAMSCFSFKGLTDGMRGYALEQKQANTRLKNVFDEGKIVKPRTVKKLKRQNVYQKSCERKRENKVFDTLTDYTRLKKEREYEYLKQAGLEDVADYFDCDPRR